MVADAPRQLVEFRSYRIVRGGIDAFVEHFENHFLASQEELGMDIVGQFRVVADPERFVWVRRYLDPSSRAASLTQFYSGPVWKEFGPRANELMLDYTDVYLLEPDASAPDFAAGHLPHSSRERRTTEPTSTVVAAFYELRNGERAIPPRMASAFAAAAGQSAGASEIGRLVTASVPNDFPLLPVHDGVPVALWLLSDAGRGHAAVSAAQRVAKLWDRSLRVVRLTPTARSTLR